MRPHGFGLLLIAASTACSDDTRAQAVESSGSGTGSIPTGSMGTAADTSSSGGTGVATGTGDSGGTTGDTEGMAGPWQPGTVYPSLPDPTPRGLLDLRGLMHTHSVYSHDACDEMPVVDGEVNHPCFEDLRRALCQTRHDFVMFTDHPDLFAETEYPDNLLFDGARGDVLLDRDGEPMGNWSGCDDGPGPLLLAGTEGATMPVGLERHVPDRGVYGDVTPEAIEAFKLEGAVSLVAHAEDWTVEQLETLPLDGFEMYNLHANTLLNIAAAVGLIAKIADGNGLPHPDLTVMPLWTEDARYLERWGTVLAHGTRRVTTAGTDAHRNTFMQELPDGERIDSFRRMMMWFSNHLLVEAGRDGTWDDRALKDALRSRRLYAAFEYMGYPEGFDARIEAGDTIVEIGGEVSFADGPTIYAVAPTVRGLDPAATPPQITVHVLRAIEGGFEEVFAGGDALEYVPDAPGAYRIEVRIVPLHLTEYLGDYVDLASEPRPWIYANAFYIDP
jgi:hypothetical protein